VFGPGLLLTALMAASIILFLATIVYLPYYDMETNAMSCGSVAVFGFLTFCAIIAHFRDVPEVRA
jgi:hypothetical protein